jgi:predicted TIM-barrel fold metal-dependent hydrolase
MKEPLLWRRDFIFNVAADLATMKAGFLPYSAHAQPVSTSFDPNEPLRVVDFHNHFLGPAFTPIVGGRNPPPALAAYFAEVNRSLADPQALLSSIELGGVAARVINTPLEFIQDPDGDVAPDLVRRINDHLAELVSRQPGRLFGLATVDAYGGEESAIELTRAITQLGLRGVFVASAKKNLLLDAPQARPTLAAAAQLGVPVFAHPITDAQLRQRLGGYGRPGTTINRGTVNSAALIALLESGTFDSLPRLRVVVTTLAIGGVLLTAAFGEGRYRTDAQATLRRHIYVDTMRLNPMLMRATIEALGADRVLAGTDWPIYRERDIPQRLSGALNAAGVSQSEQRLIASENVTRLLELR